MRRFFQRLLYKPVLRLADKFSSRPDKARVNKALNALYKSIITRPGKKGLVIPFDAKRISSLSFQISIRAHGMGRYICLICKKLPGRA
jgi:hypothetical protein